MEIPYGYCHCGCGSRTNLIEVSRPELGLIKGDPRKFLKGHHQRISADDYVVEERGYSSPCWIWRRGKSERYGRMWDGGRQRPAHVVFYERRYGPIPAHFEPDHLCRVTLCVNPDHLEVVTKSINIRRRPCTKLSLETAEQIRIASGSQRAIADLFGVSQMTVSLVRSGKRWTS